MKREQGAVITMSRQLRLQLRKFDMSSIPADKVVVFIGKRATGKSFLVRELLYHHRDIPIGTVISPTESANRFFGNMVPPVFIHDEFTPRVVDNVVKRQQMVLRQLEKQKEVYGSCSIDPRAFLLLDDCQYDNKWITDKNIRFLLMNGRHVKCMLIITMQSPLGLPPALRQQIDYVFILRENIVNNRKRLYDNYAGMFPNIDVFGQVLEQCTENYECLVINNNVQSNKLTDQVFWYKGEDRPAFKIGAPEFWALSNECEAGRKAAMDGEDDDGYDDGGDGMIDIATLGKTKNRPLVSVRKQTPQW
jgi:hypothetical protein